MKYEVLTTSQYISNDVAGFDLTLSNPHFKNFIEKSKQCKRYLLSLLSLLLFVQAGILQAQVAINTDASSPDASAMLDVKSTTKGLLAPRVTTAQRTAFVSPADGLWVYDTDTKSFWYYKAGTGWQQILNSSPALTLPFAAAVNTASTLFAVSNTGSGIAGHFEIQNAGSGATALEAVTNGKGSGATIANTNASNTSNILNVTSNGPGVIADHSQGNAGNFFMNNNYGVGAGVRGEVNSIFGNNGTAGVYGVSSGTGGYGGYFEHSNSTGFGLALEALTSGEGSVAHFETLPSTNSQPTLRTITNGTGSALTVSNTNANNTSNILNVTNNGPGVIADHSQGNAGNFFMNNNYGVGAGVRGEVNSIFGNNGTAGIYGVASGTGGYAGYFEHSETTGFGITLQVVSYDQGTAMVVDHEGTGNLAIFQKSGFNKARIDNTGKGFFNGGTQNSGADLAEAFDVEGAASSYEPGDVLLISTTADRTVTKCKEPYSSLVAGVYATKPGVLLTEDSVNSLLIGKIPMGVVGVIPTKVCDENGPIRRGDILVTSSRPGCAMKADPDKLKPGQAIGKALETFDGFSGKIRVLVNVK